MSPESDSASNGGVSSDESTSLRKRKRESEEEKEQTTEDTRRLTSRQLALKGKKGPSLFSEKKNPTKQLTVEQQRKKTQQAEKRKRQKQEQMLVQKDAILRKFANAANAPVETAPDTQKDKRSEKVNQVSDVRYTSSTSGNFLSFAPHMTLPDWVAPKEKQDERENEKEKNRSLVLVQFQIVEKLIVTMIQKQSNLFVVFNVIKFYIAKNEKIV
eukprot:CAMPEP_0201493142 /NCGR_PEP_ID=MMETSP0151_2-20130828/36234_1 /ASSEMBLY_ACC=CAM_ASM_000257 /TAXON_ID=200890 /ORGANISM="Paramoeba atlantica, Strain 621/1 / CCAP 1560/9" /LENGTH=213 /DNA_ID=CAMNT_0047880327 /DNA_START=337 /DNA_END=975 /DNA_ORIENTATION=+